MKRSIGQLQWRWVLVAALVVLGGAAAVWAGNVSDSINDADGKVRISGTQIWDNEINRYGGDALYIQYRNAATGEGGGDTILNANGGNVGIGTTNPFAKLVIAVGNAIGWDYTSGQAASRRWGINNDQADYGDFVIRTESSQGSGLNTTRFYIDASGNVGIGTTMPSKKLDVAGDINVTGNINAKYQDVAEWVPAKSALAPGTVVVIDPQERNRVLPAAQPYDTRVAGVVSARPGLLLGEAGEDKVKVAHSGRMTVKADAEYGPIAVGDLLVTSPTPGHAMRSTPLDLAGTAIHRPGTLLGKALESLAEGQGEILVLLTLQ